MTAARLLLLISSDPPPVWPCAGATARLYYADFNDPNNGCLRDFASRTITFTRTDGLTEDGDADVDAQPAAQPSTSLQTGEDSQHEAQDPARPSKQSDDGEQDLMQHLSLDDAGTKAAEHSYEAGTSAMGRYAQSQHLLDSPVLPSSSFQTGQASPLSSQSYIQQQPQPQQHQEQHPQQHPSWQPSSEGHDSYITTHGQPGHLNSTPGPDEHCQLGSAYPSLTYKPDSRYPSLAYNPGNSSDGHAFASSLRPPMPLSDWQPGFDHRQPTRQAVPAYMPSV